MDFVDGYSLKELVMKEPYLSSEKVLNYTYQLLHILIKVHQQNVLHRDIKPDNILINKKTDELILIDFGIARGYVEDKTSLHIRMYTPGYAPPEQAVESAKRGAYSDLYSVGAVMYFMLTRTRPQTMEETMLNGVIEPKDVNSKIPDWLNIVILKALKVKPIERFQDAVTFLEALEGKKENLNPIVIPPINNNFEVKSIQVDLQSTIIDSGQTMPIKSTQVDLYTTIDTGQTLPAKPNTIKLPTKSKIKIYGIPILIITILIFVVIISVGGLGTGGLITPSAESENKIVNTMNYGRFSSYNYYGNGGTEYIYIQDDNNIFYISTQGVRIEGIVKNYNEIKDGKEYSVVFPNIHPSPYVLRVTNNTMGCVAPDGTTQAYKFDKAE